MFSIDGLVWDIPCDITRVAELTASDISGLMLDKTYFNDVLGQYMSYTVKIAVPLTMRGQYASIYQALTKPVDGHVFILPYNSSTITLTARVTRVEDEYVRLAGGETYWKGTTFDIIANHPTRTVTLGQMITRGITAAPAEAVADDGDAYVYNGTTNDWDLLTDADDTAY